VGPQDSTQCAETHHLDAGDRERLGRSPSTRGGVSYLVERMNPMAPSRAASTPPTKSGTIGATRIPSHPKRASAQSPGRATTTAMVRASNATAPMYQAFMASAYARTYTHTP
jgi:hypothetical protein